MCLRRVAHGLGGIAPGEDIEYVVVDDAKSSRDRVELVSENPETYDERFYVQQLMRAAAGVLGPFGWQQEEIKEAVQLWEQCMLL